MPNQLIFGVEFTRQQIQGILDDKSTTYIIIEGNYEHLGKNVWKISATAQGCSDDKIAATAPVPGCIQPCPKG
jgi:hypothetical protein